jgi:hypothetical protein
VVPLAQVIMSTKTLRCLILKHCGLSDDEIFIIAVAVAGNSSLRELDLSNNSIGDRGAEYLSNAVRILLRIYHPWRLITAASGSAKHDTGTAFVTVQQDW